VLVSPIQFSERYIQVFQTSPNYKYSRKTIILSEYKRFRIMSNDWLLWRMRKWKFEFHNTTILSLRVFLPLPLLLSLPPTLLPVTTTTTTAITTTNCVSDHCTTGEGDLGTHWQYAGWVPESVWTEYRIEEIRSLRAKKTPFSGHPARIVITNHYTDWTKRFLSVALVRKRNISTERPPLSTK
jgi:hypothetical protein